MLLAAGMVFVAGLSVAQEPANDIVELQRRADELGQRTFARKSGKVVRFSEIPALSAAELRQLVDHEMTDADADAYEKYLDVRLLAGKAINAEVFKARDAALADLAKSTKASEAALASLAKNTRLLLDSYDKLLARDGFIELRDVQFLETILLRNQPPDIEARVKAILSDKSIKRVERRP